MATVTVIDPQKVRQSGSDLIENVTRMYKSLNVIKDIIDNSKTYFDSPAGDALRTKFNNSAEDFGKFRSFLNQYGEFLKNHAININEFNRSVSEQIGEIEEL